MYHLQKYQYLIEFTRTRMNKNRAYIIIGIYLCILGIIVLLTPKYIIDREDKQVILLLTIIPIMYLCFRAKLYE